MTTGNRDLEALRQTASQTLIVLLWLHVPIAASIGMMRGADWIIPTLFMVALAAAATVSWRSSGNGLSTRLTVAGRRACQGKESPCHPDTSPAPALDLPPSGGHRPPTPRGVT